MTEELDQTCWKCGECKPIFDFRMDVEKGWRKLKCMACEAAEVPQKPLKSAPWRATPEDEQIIRDLYPSKGSATCKLLIPKATNRQIQATAKRLGVHYEVPHVAGSPPNLEPAWPLPQHVYTEADIALRQWRAARPVARVFAPSLGLAA